MSEALSKLVDDSAKRVITLIFDTLQDDSLSPNERMDRAESLVATLPQVECPAFHEFCDGQYVREVFAPAYSALTSVTHLQKHPLFILKGELLVCWIEGEKLLSHTFTAPTYTITTPGTRRFTIVIEDCNAVAVFRSDATTPDAVFEELMENRPNPLLSEDFVPIWKRANAQSKELSR